MSASAIRRKEKSSRHRSENRPWGWSKSVLSSEGVYLTTVTRKGPNPHGKKSSPGGSALGLLAATVGLFSGVRRKFGSRGES